MTRTRRGAFALCCAAAVLSACGDSGTGPTTIEPVTGSTTGTFKTSLAGWHVVSGTWSETAAGEQGVGTSTSDAWFMSTDLGTDFAYEGDLTITTGNAAQLIFRSQTQTPSAGAYVATISKNNNFVRLYEYPSGATIGTAFPLSVVLGKTYHMKVVALGANIRVYVDGVNDNAALIDVTDPTPFVSGFFGVAAATSTSTFQNVTTGVATKSPFNTNLSGWAPIQGMWSTTEVGVTGTAMSGDAWYMSTTTASDFAIEADLTITTGNAAQLVFRSQAANPSAGGAYVATISTNNNWVRLLKYTGSGIVAVGNPVKFSDLSPSAPAVAVKTTYHMKVLAIGKSIKVYISGLNGGAPLIDTTDASFSGGFLGLAASTSTSTFQNVYKNQFNTNLTGWSVASGTWLGTPFGQQGTNTSSGDAWYMSADAGSDFVFESDVTVNSGNAAQLVFRAQSDKDLFKGAYVVTLSKANNWVKLLKYPGPGLGVTGVGDAFKFPTSTPLALNTVYHMKVVAVGSSIKVYVRGVNNDSALFERIDTSFAAGKFGIAASGSSATFQNAIQCAMGKYYVDGDHDGYGKAGSAATSACVAPAGMVADASDCNDAAALVHPGVSETCNGVDDNCSGSTDEGAGTTYFADGDGDGYGASAGPSQEACAKPAGYEATGGDCDDVDAGVHPTAIETCNERDDDCDAVTDELVTSTYFVDVDGDGYGDPEGAVEACSQAPGLVFVADDCDDDDGAVHPGVTEKCDGVDENCDGATDEWLTSTSYYEDADGDGYGNPSGAVQEVCFVPEGFVANAADCDDTNAATKPGASETCNKRDDNCNGDTDEGERIYLMADHDGDGYGNVYADDTQIGCDPPEGFTTLEGDCNDADATVHPTALDACDGVDDDCNRVIDDNGICSVAVTCPANDGYEPNGTRDSARWIGLTPGTTIIQRAIACSAGGTADDDWYAFDLLAGDVLSLANPDGARLDVALYDGQDALLGSATSTSPLAYVAPADETVTLLVASAASADVAYGLAIRLDRCGGCGDFEYCEVDQCKAGCGFDDQCGELERCDVEAHACVTTDCRVIQCQGLTYCETATGACVSGCADDGQCTGDERCNEATHACEFPGFVAAVFPEDGADVVSTGTDVTIEFGSAMDHASTAAAFHLALAGSNLSGVLTWSGDSKRAWFDADARLAPCTTYTASLGATAATAAGEPLGAPYAWSFKTACGTLSFEQKQTAMAAMLAKVVELDSAGPYSEQSKQALVSYALGAQSEYFAKGGVDGDGSVQLSFVDGSSYPILFETVVLDAAETAPAPDSSARTAETSATSATADASSSSASDAPGLPGSNRVVLMEADMGYYVPFPDEPRSDDMGRMLTAAGYLVSTQAVTINNLMHLGDGGPIGVLAIHSHGTTTPDEAGWMFTTDTRSDGERNPTYEQMETDHLLVKSGVAVKVWDPLTPGGWAQLETRPVWGVQRKFLNNYVLPHLAPNALVLAQTCNSWGLEYDVKFFADAPGVDKHITVAVTTNLANGGAHGPWLTLLNWLLGADDYARQSVVRPAYAVRPFGAEAVAKAMATTLDADGVALNFLGFSDNPAFQKVVGNTILAPSIRNVEFDASDPAHVRAIAYGQFGTTDLDDVTVTLGGVAKAVVVDASQLACPTGETGDCSVIVADLGDDPCGELQFKVRGIKSNVVPLTCWSASVSLVTDLNPYSCAQVGTTEWVDDNGGSYYASGTTITSVSPPPPAIPLTIDCDLTVVADARAYRAASPASAPDKVVARKATVIPAKKGCEYRADGSATYSESSDFEGAQVINDWRMYFTGSALVTAKYTYYGSGTLPNTSFSFELDIPSDASDGVMRVLLDPMVVPLEWSSHTERHDLIEYVGAPELNYVSDETYDDRGTLDEPLTSYEADPAALPNDPGQEGYLSVAIPIAVTGPECASASTELVLVPRVLPDFSTPR